MTPDKLQAIQALQAQVKADGFKSMPGEKAFMDEMSGEVEIEWGERLTHLTPAQMEEAPIWWAGLSERAKEERREHAEKMRRNFGIIMPEEDDEQGWAEVCYEDKIS